MVNSPPWIVNSPPLTVNSLPWTVNSPPSDGEFGIIPVPRAQVAVVGAALRNYRRRGGSGGADAVPRRRLAVHPGGATLYTPSTPPLHPFVFPLYGAGIVKTTAP
eukprot:858334-Prorocentrum_minimum.AAC.1